METTSRFVSGYSSLPYLPSHKLVGYVGYAPEQRTVIVAHQGFDVRPL